MCVRECVYVVCDDEKYFSMYSYIFVQFYVNLYTFITIFLDDERNCQQTTLPEFSLKNLFETLMLEVIKLPNSCEL